MANWNVIFGLFRAITIYFTTLASVLVLFVGASLVSFGSLDLSAWLAIAAASLTLATLPLMLFLSIYRHGAFTSIVVVELLVTGILWILWLIASGASAGNSDLHLFCRDAYYYYNLSRLQLCVETDILTAFSFINWIMLMILNITLFVLAIIQSKRGNNIWTGYVTDVNSSAPVTEEHVDPVNPVNPQQSMTDGANPPPSVAYGDGAYRQPVLGQQYTAQQPQFPQIPPYYRPQVVLV